MVAILVTDGFEQSELSEPRAALDAESRRAPYASEDRRVRRGFCDAGKPVAAICDGPWMAIEAGAARGGRIAAWPSLKADLRNAGAEWVDEEVVVDGNLGSSRKPADLSAFNRAMLRRFAHGRRHTHQAA